MNNGTRQRIIEAAYELFVDGSFHSVGVDAICKKASVNKGTLYHFFHSKADILAATLDYYTDLVEAMFEESLRNIQSADQRIIHFFELAKKKNEKYKADKGFCSGCFIANIALELSSSEQTLRDEARWCMFRLLVLFRSSVAPFLSANNLEAADSTKVSQSLMGLFQGAAVMARLEDDVRVFDNYAKTALDFVISAAKSDIMSKEPA